MYGIIQFNSLHCSISGNTLAPTGQQYDNKTGQWFGSLVRSSGEDGVVLVSIGIINISIWQIKASFRTAKVLVIVPNNEFNSKYIICLDLVLTIDLQIFKNKHAITLALLLFFFWPNMVTLLISTYKHVKVEKKIVFGSRHCPASPRFTYISFWYCYILQCSSAI